jgi:hypothetical protein
MRPSPLRRFAGLVAFTAALWSSARAQAADCQPANGVSPCFDANEFWLTTGDARFFSLPTGRVLAPGRVAIAFAASATWRSLHLNVPSSNADGRDVDLVKRAMGEETLLAIGLGNQLELGLALPVVLHQVGSGSQGITSQNGVPLDPSAERDPRVSVSMGLLFGALRLKPHLTLGLPLGNRDGYASSGAFTFAPALPLALRHGRFEHAVEFGFRFRPSVEIGSVRLGSEASIAAGSSLALLADDFLVLAAEAFILPSLVDNRTARAKSFDAKSTLLAAEYVVSLRCRPSARERVTLAIGAGSALALSRQSSPVGDERFVAPGGPALRVLAEVRYTPE